MKPDKWYIEPYHLTFKAPFRFAGKTLSGRDGYYLRVISGGTEFVGEFSPLPEFSGKSPHLIEESFPLLNGFLENFDTDEWESEMAQLDSLGLPPEVRSGLEQAIAGYYCSAHGKIVWDYLKTSPKKELFVNGIISENSPADILQEGIRLVEKGFTALKIKVGVNTLSEEINALEGLRKRIGDEILIRLDANRSWEWQEALERMSAYQPYSIEYIEEPLKNHGNISGLQRETGISIAADESITDLEVLRRLVTSRKYDVLVIKPALLGMLREILPILREASENGQKLIITSALDSQFGKRKSVLLAACLAGSSHHGLGTADLFINGYEDDIYPVFDGKINLAKAQF